MSQHAKHAKHAFFSEHGKTVSSENFAENGSFLAQPKETAPRPMDYIKRTKVMNENLKRNLFLVKEHVGMFKAANNYDIHDPETGEIILMCREDNLGFFTKMLRFTDYKRMTPFDVEVRTPEGETLIRVKRGISLFLSNVEVFDENDQLVGGFKQKLFSIGGAFSVLDENGSPICDLKGKWTGWDFRFMAGNKELAHVSKKFAGMAREFFTSADNYVLEISEDVPADNSARQLIMAAVMCIDMVLKE
ncbi:MAG: hypothetical protein ACI97A_000192 [Planctomycetota bacterium]